MIELAVAVQPAPNACSSMALYPPVAACLRSSTNIYEQLGRYWAIATLVHSSGETLDDRLGRRVFDSTHPMKSDSGEDRAYFYFSDLVIRDPGRYCIRISLWQMDYSFEDPAEGVAIVRAYADTDWIDVGDSPVNQTRPSKLLHCYRGQSDQISGPNERRFLKKLRDDGQYIPSAST